MQRTKNDQLFDWQLGFGHDAVVFERMLRSDETRTAEQAVERLSAIAEVLVAHMAVELL